MLDLSELDGSAIHRGFGIIADTQLLEEWLGKGGWMSTSLQRQLSLVAEQVEQLEAEKARLRGALGTIQDEAHAARIGPPFKRSSALWRIQREARAALEPTDA